MFGNIDRQVADRLRGTRVLVVEDEFLVALELEAMLEAMGCDVVATVPDFPGALQAVNRRNFDVAILDINLDGQESYPVADRLLERGLPLLFSTGYTPSRLPERFRALPYVQKPIIESQLKERLLRLLDQRD